MIRVLTWNIRGGRGVDGRCDLRRIAEVLVSADADILCLQEARRAWLPSGSAHQADALARQIGAHGAYQNSFSGRLFGFGVAVLTRKPMVRIERLAPNPSVRSRGAILAEIEGVGWVASVHWGLRADERTFEAQALADFLAHRTGPKIVGGDFNETVSGDAVRMLMSRARLSDAGVGSCPTFPSIGPASRIDMLLSTPEWAAQRCEVIETLASDHFAVVAEFEQAGH